MAVLVYIGTFLLIPLIYFLRNVIRILWKIYQNRKVLLTTFPAPDCHWLYGHMHVFPGLNEEGLLWNMSMTAKYPRYYVLAIGPLASLQLSHPETIKQLTKTAEPKQLSLSGGYKPLLPWIGDGLLLSSGNKWFRNRKLLTPGFHFDVLKPYVKIYNNCVEKLMDLFEQESALLNKSLDIFKPVNHCALDIILQCAFSSKRNIQGAGDNEEYAKTINVLGRQVLDRAMQPLLYPDFIYYRTKEGKSFKKNCEYSHKIARGVIEKRTKEMQNAETIQELSQKRYVDFLDILLLARDEEGNGLTQQEIMDEVETFMFEGHDTTTSGIAWILYSLAKHPDIQARVREEIDSLLEGRPNDTLEWADMNELPYLTRCIKESLRLYTPVPFIGRELTKPLQMDDKTIPAGVYVDINIWNLHHNPTVWENPMSYDPDRFLPENISKMDSHAFMPFSAGPRNCIGQNFAMNEMKTTAARIIRRFELAVDTSKEVKLHPDVVMRSKSGIHVFFTNRK